MTDGESKQYVTALGVVQGKEGSWGPEEKEVNGKPIINFQIRVPHSQNKLQVTVWKETHPTAEIKIGDLVAVDGEYRSREAQTKEGDKVTYRNVWAKTLVIIPQVPAVRGERQTANVRPQQEPVF